MDCVFSIHIAPGSRLAMKPVDVVEAEAGKGLIGDRYHGTRHRHVSVQSLQSLNEAAEILGAPIPPESTRRNITLQSAAIPREPGFLFCLGPVKLQVVRIAAPCRLLDDVIGSGAARALSNRAGSVCRVLEGGTIRVGDQVRWLGQPESDD